MNLRSKSSTAALWQKAKIFSTHLVKDFIAMGCQKNAAALTYMTLFALVPLMTVIYTVFSMVPMSTGLADQLQSFVFSHFVPESGQEVQSYLTNFSSQARSLTSFGIGMLVVTAYLMLTNIEKTFNMIWGVTQARRGLSSFLLYWAVLSLGPLLIGAAFAMSTYLLSLKILVKEYDGLGIAPYIFQLFPILMTSSAFTLLFIAVPNCRVPLRFAAIGGGVTAICFELLKLAFASLVANSSFELIYGAFAVVPLFLIWINLMWMVILAGAILVRTLAERRYTHVEGRMTDMVVALQCLDLMFKRSFEGLTTTDKDCYKLGVGVVHWQRLRQVLVDHDWVAVTRGDRYVVCRDLNLVSLWDLAEILELSVCDLSETISKSIDRPWFKHYLSLRENLLSEGKSVFSASVESLFLKKGFIKEELINKEFTEKEPTEAEFSGAGREQTEPSVPRSIGSESI